MSETFVLDAGHGLPDPGASKYVKEYIIAMQLLKKTKSVLERHGAKVILTRTSDKSLSSKSSVSQNKNEDLNKRVQIINDSGADLVVSFHLNAGGGTGYETLGYKTTDAKVKKFHGIVADFFESKGFKDRGIKASSQGHLGGVAIIDRTKPTVVLGEFLFVDTKKDADAISDPAFQDELAEAVAKAALETVGAKYSSSGKKASAPAKTEVKKESAKPAASSSVTEVSKSDAGKRLECIYSGKEGVNYYSKASFDDDYRVGAITKGLGFPTIVRKVRVGGSEMYEVKNSKGASFYITSRTDLVKVEGTAAKAASKPAASSSKTISGIKVAGYIKIVNVKNAAYICDKASSNSKNVGTAKLGEKLPISGSVPGWYEVIYGGKRRYVNEKYGKRV
jgi:N-acetylmuramoyl-L-alanine amidase